MKFLLLRLSSIGDIVLTSPVVRCLKQQHPDAEIHFLTKRGFEDVVRNNPYIDAVHLVNDNAIDNELLSNLKEERFDAVIDLHHNLRTLKIKRALDVTSFSFNKLNIEKWLLVNFKMNRMPNVHIVDRYMKTVSSFGVTNDDQGLDYFITPEDERAVDSLPEHFRKKYIAWVVGAAHATKQLPAAKMISIGKKIKSPIVLLGGKNDAVLSSTIKNALGENVFDACGNFSLNESAALVKHASVVFTNDTGLMHIAAAFRKKIYSFWGNTVPEFGMYPYLPSSLKTNSAILEVKNLRCRPCSKIGFDKCPKGHFKCMNEIDEKVFSAL